MKEENNVCLSKLESDSTYLSKPKRGRAGKTQEKFIEEVSKIHPEYDYSKVEYTNNKTKVEVICKKHGSFFAQPNTLLKGCGCPQCAERDRRLKRTKPNDTFIKQVQEVSPQYDYSKVEYVNNKTKVEVICKEHGSFYTTPADLLKGCGCMKCYHKRRVKDIELTYDKFKKKLLEEGKGHLHIKEEDYKDRNSPLVFTCNIHGVQHTNRAYKLMLNKYGCPKCGNVVGGEKQRVSYETFLKKATKKFKGKFTYLEDTYKGNVAKMVAICPQHGEITIIPYLHLNQMYGCKKCAVENSPTYKPYFDKPTTLYYIKILKDNKEYFKLGITTTKISQRFKSANVENFTYEIIATKTFETGSTAYYLEQYLLHKYKMNIIDFILLPKSGGNSEIFNLDIFVNIKQYFD